MTHSTSTHSGSHAFETSTSDTTALRRAIRRHQRALQALQGISFEGISSDKTQQLRHRLQRELADLQQQLQQQPTGTSTPARI